MCDASTTGQTWDRFESVGRERLLWVIHRQGIEPFARRPDPGLQRLVGVLPGRGEPAVRGDGFPGSVHLLVKLAQPLVRDRVDPGRLVPGFGLLQLPEPSIDVPRPDGS